MAFSVQDSAAARNAIFRGDTRMLERYTREGASGAAPVSVTTATVTFNPTTHAGKPILFNKSDGITATLPYATGTQDRYLVIVQTAWASSSLIIKVGRSADTMIGAVMQCTLAGSGSLPDGVGSTDDTITMAGTTTGGLAGSWVELTDIVTNLWLVRGSIIGSGTMITSFSATV